MCDLYSKQSIRSSVLTRGCFVFHALSGFCIPCIPNLIWFINKVCLCFGKHSQEITYKNTMVPSPWVTILITGETVRSSLPHAQSAQSQLCDNNFLFDLNAIVNSTARGNDGNIVRYTDCSQSGRVAEHARNFLCK